MADGVIAESHVVAVCDDGVVPLADGQRDKVIGFALERGRDRHGNGGNHPLKIEGVDRDFAGAGVADAIGSLRHGSKPNNLCRAAGYRLRCLRHAAFILHTAGPAN